MLHYILLLGLLTPLVKGLVANLTVGGLPSPALGLDVYYEDLPAFAWQTSSTSPQRAYRLVVTAVPSNATVWDSLIVPSNSSQNVPYGGAQPLSFDADFTYTVQLQYADGTSETSAPATFSTSLDSAAWAQSNTWIASCTHGQVAPMLRRNFTLPSNSPITRARAHATGVGLYILHVNGEVVGGEAVLAPGWSTTPAARVNADTHDVSALLRPGGENVLGIMLGQGRSGGYLWEFCSSGGSDCFGALLHLSIVQADGTQTLVTTDTQWTCSPSPIVSQSLYNGETYNASLEQPGWDAPGFVAPPWAAPWAPVRAGFGNPPMNVSLVSSGVPPIRVMSVVEPKSVRPTSQPAVPPMGGVFIVSDATGSGNPFWWASNTTVRNPVQGGCWVCSVINACAYTEHVTDAVMAGLSLGDTFNCSQLLPVSAYVFDMGRNLAGRCTLQLPPPPAQPASAPPLALLHGETLDLGGHVVNSFGASYPSHYCSYNQMNCADQLDFYYFPSPAPPTPSSTWTPSLTFHGFRYVALFGWPDGAQPPTTTTLSCQQLYSDMATVGGLVFPPQLDTLNSIQSAIVQTQKSNFLSLPSDCPTREKRGWLGDSGVTVGQALYNFRAGALYRNWLRSLSETAAMGCSSTSASSTEGSSVDDPASVVSALDAGAGQGPTPPLPVVRPSQYLCCSRSRGFGCQGNLTPSNATGFLPDMVPFDSISAWPGDWVWQVAALEISAALLKMEGDVRTALAAWPMLWNLLGAAAYATQGGLLRFGPYGDWMAAQGSTTLFAENVYLVRGALLGADVAAALGRSSEAAALCALAGATDGVLTGAFFNTSTGVWVRKDGQPPLFGAQNTQALALSVALGGSTTAGATTTTIAAAMAADVAAQGSHPTCGVASCRWVLQGLSAANLSTLALGMATQRTPPSWAYMVATPDMPGTLWEVWAGNATNSAGGSKNHAMLGGGIGLWLYENALGLRFGYVRARARGAVAGGWVPRPCPLFSFSPQARWGLSDALASAACEAARELVEKSTSSPWLVAQGQGGGISLAALEARVRHLALHAHPTPPMPLDTPPPALRPTLTLAPDAALIPALGAAEGHFDAPSGRCSLSWRSTPSAFALNATAPWGVGVRLALPLELLRGGKAVKASGSGGIGGGRLVTGATAAALGAGAGACTLLRIDGDEHFWCTEAMERSQLPTPWLATPADVEGLGRQWGSSADAAGCTWEACTLMFEWEEGGLENIGVVVG